MRIAKILLSLSLFGVLLLSACGGGNAAEETPTPSVDQIQTSAVQTLQVYQTQTALAVPTATATLTPTATSTTSPLPTLPIGTLPTNTAPAVASTASCNKLLYLQDVTIPDNTTMTPGESFTKTWRVQNTGSCTWAVGYKFVMVAGDAMSGQALTLSQTVAPGAQFDISVPMVAPTKAGKFTGTWRMSDAAGTYFGDPLTVVIVVGGSTATAYP